MDDERGRPSAATLRKRVRAAQRKLAELATALNLTREAFSRKLNRTSGRSFTRQEALKLLTTLVEWAVVTSPADVQTWFAWLGYDRFTDAEWASITQELVASAASGVLLGGADRATPLPLQRPPRVRHFTGRAAELRAVLAELMPGHVVTLCGPGGIGKTTLATAVIWHLARQNAPPRRFPDGIIFHSFYRQPRAELALEHIVRSLGEEPRPSAASAALRVLDGKRLLVVLDGAEAADNLPAVLEVCSSCGVLVTTRQRKDADGEPRVIVALAHAESVALFQAWAGRYAGDASVGHAICALLGGLPLAIRLAGHYVLAQQEDARTYLAWLQRTPLAALDQGERQHSSIPLLLDRSVQQLSPAARQLLGYIGMLALAPFDTALIAAICVQPNDTIPTALAELVEYSLLWHHEGTYELSHALIHTYARDRLGPIPDSEAQRDRIATVIHGLNAQFPSPDYAQWDRCTMLIPHVLALLQIPRVESFPEPALVELLVRAGTYLGDQARFAEGRSLIDAAHAIAQARYGAMHPLVAATLHAEALLDDALGAYEQAEARYQQALRIKEQQSNADPLDIARTLRALANLFDNRGRYAEAEALYRQVLDIQEQVLGLDHRDVIATVSELAWVYDRQGRYAEGAAFLRATLAQAEQTLGTKHPLVAFVVHNLATLVEGAGHMTEAEQLHQRAIELKTQTLGSEHPELATSLHNLGRFYEGQRRYAEAERLLQQALRIKEQTLGANHPEVAYTLNNLARLYSQQRRYAEAEPLFQRALTIKITALGPAHPSVAYTLNNQARMFMAQQQYDKADELFQQTLALRERAHGPDHPDVAITLDGWADLAMQQGYLDRAEHRLVRALGIREDVLGSGHPDTEATRQRLAEVYRRQGNRDAAERLMQRAVGEASPAEQPDGEEALPAEQPDGEGDTTADPEDGTSTGS